MKKIAIANWKNHPSSLVEAKKIFKAIERGTRKDRSRIVICPPTLYLQELTRMYRGSRVFFGAQDISSELKGSWTGEVSGTMLKRSGASYVIIGHSERRALGETSEMSGKKINRALESGLIPVLCVGEKERDSDARYLQVLEEMITKSLEVVPKNAIKKVYIAYEPVFAIGKSASDALRGSDVHHMVLFIKKILVGLFGRNVGMAVPILYGGSVEKGNVADLAKENISGFLVGHASLVAAEFSEIAKSLE